MLAYMRAVNRLQRAILIIASIALMLGAISGLISFSSDPWMTLALFISSIGCLVIAA